MLNDAWALAIETLSWIELRRLGERLALTRATKQLQIEDPKAAGLAHKLVFETLRRLNIIDALLNLAVKPHSLSEFKLGVKSFLRVYTYRVMFEGADFDSAVAMARTGRAVLGWRELSDVEEALGGILTMQLSDALKGTSDDERVALQTYNPTWFVKYCVKMMGRREALSFLEGSSRSTPTYVRLNTIKASEEDCLRQLENENVDVEKTPSLQHTYKVLRTQKPLARTNAFREGLFYVQDKASCLAVEVADPKPEDKVVDVCAAPGAKTSYLAQLMQNRGQIYSLDYSKRRMSVWKQEIKRMGVGNASAISADAQKPAPLKIEADLVVLDPPCTSTGAFGKAPSAKWRLTKRSVQNMAEVQWNMLTNCADMVKRGGDLVYSTCSVSLEENEMLIERFLKWNLDFKLVEAEPRIGLLGFRGQSQCQRLFPHIHECNGFFVAKLRKESS